MFHVRQSAEHGLLNTGRRKSIKEIDRQKWIARKSCTTLGGNIKSKTKTGKISRGKSAREIARRRSCWDPSRFQRNSTSVPARSCFRSSMRLLGGRPHSRLEPNQRACSVVAKSPPRLRDAADAWKAGPARPHRGGLRSQACLQAQPRASPCRIPVPRYRTEDGLFFDVPFDSSGFIRRRSILHGAVHRVVKFVNLILVQLLGFAGLHAGLLLLAAA